MSKGNPPGVYGSIAGYSPQTLTEADLSRYRTGLSPANPSGTMLMAQEIDRLREELSLLKLSQSHSENNSPF
jgi:hypothetical protein